MKNKVCIFILIGLISLLTACGATRETIINLSESDIKNVEALKVVSRNLLKSWRFYSGLIRKSLGVSIVRLPSEAITAMEDLDELALTVDELSDYELGSALGSRIMLLGAVVREAIRLYAPSVLDLLPRLM